MPNVAALTAELVRIPSINPPGDEQPAADFLAGVLADAGLPVTRVPVAGHGDTLLAVLPGAGAAPARIFTGHLDVVPVSAAERPKWDADPFSGHVADGRLWGRGSTDMKGGVAAIVTAASGLLAEGRTPPGDVLLVLTSDEEDLMGGSRAVAGHPLLARDADVVVCEPTGLTLCTIGRGRTWAKLTVRGETGHGSQGGAPNAIELAVELINELAAEDFTAVADPEHGPSFWRPLAIGAGVEPCVVPDVCTLTVDARLAPDHDPADVWARLAAIVGRLRSRHPGLVVDVDVVDAREGWRTPAASALVRQASAGLAALGRPDAAGACFAGTTDGTVLRRPGAGHGTRDVIICGPGDLPLAHRQNESVALTDLDDAVALYRHLMLRA